MAVPAGADAAAGNHPDVKAWLAKNPRITMHFTPTSGSWMNMVENLLRHHRPPSHPPRHLHQRQRPAAAIRTFIGTYNQRCEPFRWARTADQILSKASHRKNSDTRS
ncbi:hypothetical protein ACH4T9_18030 [Micromonospora sp. NPDC020750]|uniref:hypothetical protein n=1 Tax=unclassified Micromonospora TaxID=2617518 RepID=UPI0037995A2B